MASQIVKRGIQTATVNLANPGTAASAGHGGKLSKIINLWLHNSQKKFWHIDKVIKIML